jgi:signal recognition particle subunit SRP9
MVLVESLDSFVEQAEALYKHNPLKSRYVIKYSHCKGKLSLKVTDNRTSVQYKTDRQTDLRKVDSPMDLQKGWQATASLLRYCFRTVS